MVEGKTSSRAEVTSGVPQGSVLGSLLFLLFINDLPNYLQEKSTVRLFADDAVLYRQINNAPARRGLTSPVGTWLGNELSSL